MIEQISDALTNAYNKAVEASNMELNDKNKKVLLRNGEKCWEVISQNIQESKAHEQRGRVKNVN